MSAPVYPLATLARLPDPQDNAAIAIRRLEAGTQVQRDGQVFSLDNPILEGHRFAVRPIPPGAPILSWGMPFGLALQAIAPGQYLTNASTLEVLRGRHLDAGLRAVPNFADHVVPYPLDQASFRPAEQVSAPGPGLTFLGYPRGPRRGVGIRNYILLLGLTSKAAAFVTRLESLLRDAAQHTPGCDGIVAVAHTEGSLPRPNNLDHTLRALAGFLVHPNAAAVLVVDPGPGGITFPFVQRWMNDHEVPLEDVLLAHLPLSASFESDLERGRRIVANWLPALASQSRRPAPLSELKLALQCGGSDSFSGISGNPLAAWLAREVVAHGGAANLAETTELIGAEAYVLQKVKDYPTAQRFLEFIETYKQRAAWHGSSAEGNPSAGNKVRGLYNIALKSLGAAMKRHPDVRLDGALEYGQRLPGPGYYFMDSPGLDTESIAGQVATGCNLILFITGNGSVTNFPFAPTLKIVTTTRRFQHLAGDMDINAGEYLDGTPMEELAHSSMDLMLAVASGQSTVGERAGHAQVQLWRDWGQSSPPSPDQPSPQAYARQAFSGQPIPVLEPPSPIPAQALPGLLTPAPYLGLILPSSLCSSRVAVMAADHLNRQEYTAQSGVERFVALPHTEGCTSAQSPGEMLATRTLLGYLTHPLVRCGLVIEHGCEVTHNDYIKARLEQFEVSPERFGWASVQGDGGLLPVLKKIEAWFAVPPPAAPARQPRVIRLGLLSDGPLTLPAAATLSTLTRQLVAAGGAVLLSSNDRLLKDPAFTNETFATRPDRPTLAYSQPLPETGCYVMDTPTLEWSEILTGLAAGGVDLLLVWTRRPPAAGHPLVPTLFITEDEQLASLYRPDLDLVLSGLSDGWTQQILGLLAAVAARRLVPRSLAQERTAVQITRGPYGISL